MSTPRRLLGTGPNSTRRKPLTDAAPRLLPVERVVPDALLGDVEHQDVHARKGRRTLGPGIEATPSVGEPLESPNG